MAYTNLPICMIYTIAAALEFLFAFKIFVSYLTELEFHKKAKLCENTGKIFVTVQALFQ